MILLACQILLSFACLNSYSQNWLPVNPSYKYNYSPNGNGYDSTVTIHVDSTGVSGFDSIYYLNRIVVQISYNEVVINMPQFLQRTMIKKNNGDIIFLDTSSFLIKPFSSVGDNWMFDIAHNVTAQLMSVEYISVLGNNDSVKIIVLSSSDTILLSQDYGLIQFSTSYLNPEKYKLVGVEGPNVGLQLPSFNDIYNFNVGDIFEYVETFSQSTQTVYSTFQEWWDYKFTIQSKTISLDTISYGISVLEKATLWTVYGYPYNIVYSNYSSTLRFINHQLPYLYYYNHEQESNCQKMYLYNDTIFIENGKGFIGEYCPGPYTSDTIGITPEYNHHSEKYATNRGLIDSYTITWSPPNSVSYDSALVGCKLNGITYGTLNSDSYMTGEENISLPTNDFYVFPNPTTNNITIHQSINAINSNLTITDVYGRETYKVNLLNNDSKIDISKWSVGVYFYKIINDHETVQGKFIKE